MFNVQDIESGSQQELRESDPSGLKELTSRSFSLVMFDALQSHAPSHFAQLEPFSERSKLEGSQVINLQL